MKKLLLLITIVMALASCSKDDECQKVTFLEAKKQPNGSFIYTIQIDNGEMQTTNKATVDYYSHIEAPECYEGMK